MAALLCVPVLATSSARRLGQARRFFAVGAATREEPHRNLMNVPWWTDGLRLVVEVPDSKSVVPLEDQLFFYWDWPDEDAEAFNERLRRLAE